LPTCGVTGVLAAAGADAVSAAEAAAGADAVTAAEAASLAADALDAGVDVPSPPHADSAIKEERERAKAYFEIVDVIVV
jgi:hypothetical protein